MVQRGEALEEARDGSGRARFLLLARLEQGAGLFVLADVLADPDVLVASHGLHVITDRKGEHQGDRLTAAGEDHDRAGTIIGEEGIHGMGRGECTLA